MAVGHVEGVRIGELSRRVGVQPATLRAWERRYGIPLPVRSRSGQRFYGADQERRVRRMLARMAEGFSPQVAARIALEEEQPATAAAAAPAGPAPTPAGAAGVAPLAAALRDALDDLDERRAHAALDRLLSACGLDVAIRDVVLPYLGELGERWARGEATVAQEHYASALLGGRLRALARPAGAGHGPRAVLACPPGERHDLGLLCFGLVLQDRGWRVTTLGADTPLDAMVEAAGRVEADLVVLAGALPEPLAAAADDLGVLGLRCPLALGGRGATPEAARRADARLLPGDVVEAADGLAATPVSARA